MSAVRTINPAEHLDFLRSQPRASFLQTPAWGEVKSEWRAESIGWYEGNRLIGAGLVLYRGMPRVGRSLAYFPEGPVLDWTGPGLADSLAALRSHVRERGAFGVRIGPPVFRRRWHAATVKKAVADDTHRRLGDVPADERADAAEQVAATLRAQGWRPIPGDGGFGLGQPAFVFQLPLAGRSEGEVLAGMSQQWRRNIKKAAKAGVEVSRGSSTELPAFHALYAETARRDGFRPRPLSYFEQMFAALLGEDDDRIRLYLARHDGDLVAATTWVRLGAHIWYSYGASSTGKREVRGSNAIQWRMIRDAIAIGAGLYDLRGIADTLDESDQHFGLTQFKLGTGGDAVEYLGEWDLPISGLLYKAFDLYLRWR